MSISERGRLNAASQIPWGALNGLTFVMSGGLRGLGLAIASAASAQGANVVILVRPAPGDDDRAVEIVDLDQGVALVLRGDIRSADDVGALVELAVSTYGGIDACLNVASVLALAGTEDLHMDDFDLMHQVNVRGAFLLTRTSLPHLRRSKHGHILTISPPLNMSERWLGAHPAYTSSKYAMTVLGLGWAAELADSGVASNCLWPESTIATPGEQTLLAGAPGVRSRRPEVVADAAMEVLSRSPSAVTGRCFLDAEVLYSAGVEDLSFYGGGISPDLDLFVDAQPPLPQGAPA